MVEGGPELSVVGVDGGAMGANTVPAGRVREPDSHSFAQDDERLADTVHVFPMSTHESTHDPFDLWTEEVLSERLGIPVKTLQRWRAYGGGPRFVKVGRQPRYRPASVLDWLESREVQISREAS